MESRLSIARKAQRVEIFVPLWHIGRLENRYVRANQFVPERWYLSPELIRYQRGFAPFLIVSQYFPWYRESICDSRPASEKFTSCRCLHSCWEADCVDGVAARHRETYHDLWLCLSKGNDGSEMFDKMVEYFVFGPGPNNLVFTSRKLWSQAVELGIVLRRYNYRSSSRLYTSRLHWVASHSHLEILSQSRRLGLSLQWLTTPVLYPIYHNSSSPTLKFICSTTTPLSSDYMWVSVCAKCWFRISFSVSRGRDEFKSTRSVL